MLGDYGRRCLWVFDENSARLFSSLPDNRVILPPGEKFKSWDSVETIVSAALDARLSRDSWFIGFGGGVVCDITALAASLYMRGCNLALVPTTLLCMVDASLGGKTAIDFRGGKNLIGSFYPARDVLVAPATLRTLPSGEYLSGLGEVLKHALLTEDRSLYDFLLGNKQAILNRDRDAVAWMVEASLKVKASYITRDPEEKLGIRSFLNFGHTFGHALETAARFGVAHGRAVAWGMGRALLCGSEMGVTPKEVAEDGMRLLDAYGYDTSRRIGRGDWLDFWEALSKDKKRMGGSVKFVLLEGFGKPVLADVEEKLVRAAVVAAPGEAPRPNGSRSR